MTEINFKGKSLKQKIFSKKQFRASIGRKSSAFRAVMENKGVAKVVNLLGEKRVLYDAMKKRAQAAGARGFTKRDMKKVLGDIEHSGQFSHKEMHKLGEELIGGVANSRIIREHAPAQSESHFQAEHQPARVVDSHKTYAEILQKDVTNRAGNLAAEKAFQVRPNFVNNNSSLRRAQEKGVVATSGNNPFQKNATENFDYIPNHLKNFNKGADISKVKSMLARIQGGEDAEGEEGEIRLAA